MIVAWFLRGYDKRTEFEAVSHRLPGGVLPLARSLVRPAAGDPDMLDPYELTVPAVRTLADRIGVPIDPMAYDYFVESSDISMIPALQGEMAPAD